MTCLEFLKKEVAKRGTDNPNCVEWPHYKNKDGYGEVGVNGIKKKVHRVAFELVNGEIPQGLEIDHGCRNRACFNPSCLEAVTHVENMKRSPLKSWRKGLTHCKRGHAFDDENTYTFPDGRRCCRTCRAVSFEKYKAKMKRGGESNS